MARKGNFDRVQVRNNGLHPKKDCAKDLKKYYRDGILMVN